MVRFLKNLLWQPPWIPLGAVMLLGLAIEVAEGAEFNHTGEHWQKPYVYAMSESCPPHVRHLYGIALDDIAPVSYERLPNTQEQGFTVDDQSIVYCSEEPPATALRARHGLAVITASVTASDGAVVGKAQWAYRSDTRAIQQCDVWLHSDHLAGSPELLTLLKHEAGHCFGLRHVDHIEAVMYSSIFWAKDWHVLDQAQMTLIYEGCVEVVHESGAKFVPRSNVDRVVRGTEWAEWEGTRVSYSMRAGGVWPYDTYDIAESVC